MKLGSLFDGIGGFPLSAIRHGIEPVCPVSATWADTFTCMTRS